jgi:hypothetical protein
LGREGVVELGELGALVELAGGPKV